MIPYDVTVEIDEPQSETPTRDLDDLIETVRHWIIESERVVFLTGAGISTDSGIPDFRGPNGLWTTNPSAQQASRLDAYLADTMLRQVAWKNRLHSPVWSASPSPGHRAIADLDRTGRLGGVITQNIDELHQRSGLSPDKVLEVHGTMHRAVCWMCRHEEAMSIVLDRVRNGEVDPPCLRCGGIIKSATISFGQALDPDVLRLAFECAESADLFLAVGSSLQVYPVAGCLPRARSAGSRVVIVNGESTKMDNLADKVLLSPISDVLPRLVQGVPSR